MADVITRFKLETTQYDSKLRDTSKALADYTRQATLAGKEFDKFTKENVEAARSFGNIATSATNSKDKINELVSAFNDVAKVYNNLTKEQQQSDFGKALGESMQQLSGRIREAKAELNSTPGLLEKLKEKFVINIDAIKLFNVGLSAAKGALDVAKDAFFASEENIDNWGRTVETGQAIYEGFLTAINTGDISGYLSRIDQITQAARDAYDELDRLSTQKAIDNPRAQAQRVENERFRAMLRTGRYIAPNDGRRATMAEGTELTADQKKRIASMLENGMKTANSIVASEIKQTTRAINALYKEQASVMGMSEKEFRNGTATMEEFNKRLEGYKQYRQFEREHTTYDGRSIVGHRDKAVNPYAEYAAWGVFKDDGKLFQRIQELINQRAGLQSQNYANTAQAYRAINTGTRTTGGGRGGNTTDTLSKIAYDENKAMLSGFKTVDTMPSVWSMLGDQGLRDMLGIGKKQTFDLGKDISTKWKVGKNGQLVDKTGKDEKQERTAEEQLQGTQTMISSLQSIVTGLDQLGIQLPKELTNIFGVLQTITGIVGAIQTMQTVGTFLGIFHNGGIVPHAASGTVAGSHFSGDVTPIMANAGEVVLNKAQTNHLANELTTRDNGSGGNGRPYVDGETIYLGLSAYLKSTGRGEIMTSRFK